MNAAKLDDPGARGHAEYIAVLLTAVFRDWLRVSLAFLISCGIQAWGGVPEGLRALAIAAAVLFCVDLLTGIMRGLRDRSFSSQRLGASLVKFLVYSLSMIAACALDSGLRVGSIFLAGVTLLVLLREATSVMENSAALGFPWPQWIVERLAKMRDDSQSGEESKDIENGV